MCAIIGLKCDDTELAAYVMSELLNQSQIRGKHASGISYVDNGKIKTITKPISSKQFVKQGFVPQSTMMIGHCRYSTSDIQYNQPISNAEMSIVHNGVITQEAFDTWKQHFGYDGFKTKNDTELLLKCLHLGHNPFKEFPNASIAAGVLHKNKMTCLRNNTRPLWLMESEYFTGFASTEDIIKRTSQSLGIDIRAFNTQPHSVYHFETDYIVMTVEFVLPIIGNKDQQIHTKSEDKYIKS